MKSSAAVDTYIENQDHWTEGLTLLRSVLLSTELEESFKWSAPVYTLNGKNVIGLGAFKHHFGIWFFNGVFLKDDHQLLEQAQDKTKSLRQMRFTSVSEINKTAVLSYVKEAIENQKLGKILKPEKKTTITIPELLDQLLKSNALLKEKFESLAPYKQREYAEYIETAKREATKQTRLEKITPMILQGLGLNDKYKNC
ncbi:YdeI/OmpD-associated family protein [Formosa sp. S-31]|uniref:YdeI/OmpD-associated family protein n=1 Tax=Formosa sp. S-31 TaxID=2790949 RepID=UPI003EBBC431